MKRILFLLALLCLEKALHAQYVYTIKADSVKITNSCDTAELILENRTQNVPGFLFNKGRGRTEFRKVLQKLSDTLYMIGGDPLHVPYAWVQGGNTFGATGIFGTMDNNHIDYYTSNTRRGRLTNTGNFLIGDVNDNGYKFQLAGEEGKISINPNLSRPGDRILIGGYLHDFDGQNALIRTSNDGGGSYKNVLVERDGFIGLGTGNTPYNWVVANPALRIYDDGRVGIMSSSFHFGNFGGPWNSSALVMAVSNVNEWKEGLGTYPNGQNHYYFGTVLNGVEPGNKRAPLFFGGRELQFYTGAGDAFAAMIKESGNVLVGTTTDNGNRFQVNGTIFSNYFTNSPVPLGDRNSAALRLRWGGGEGTYIDFYNQDNINKRGHFATPSDNRPFNVFDHIGFNFSNTPFVSIGSEWGSNSKLSVRNPFGSTMDAFTVCAGNADETIRYDLMVKTSGNVVVGGNSDNGNKLQVTGNSYFSGAQQVTGAVRFSGITNDNSQTRILVVDGSGNMYFRDASSLALNEIINSDLAVNGRVSAKQMMITQTGRWPDYVFSKQYKLPSLTEVENFINQHSHLPGIPSAAEVEKKGIDVGNNQAALLKKIEELTLYVIEQNKKIQQQSDEISELKKVNNSIEALQQQINGLKMLINGKN